MADLAAQIVPRLRGGLLNEVAILHFLVVMIAKALEARGTPACVWVRCKFV